MKLIRHGVFETNSSSCHSLSVGKSGVFEGKTPNHLNLIEIDLQEFGWAEETFYDVDSRLSYVYLYIRDWATSEKKEEFMKIFQKVVCDHTGADRFVVIESEDEYGAIGGYIDHQSVECGELDYMFDAPKILKDFLFDQNSSITTDNDNH